MPALADGSDRKALVTLDWCCLIEKSTGPSELMPAGSGAVMSDRAGNCVRIQGCGRLSGMQLEAGRPDLPIKLADRHPLHWRVATLLGAGDLPSDPGVPAGDRRTSVGAGVMPRRPSGETP